MPVNRGHYGALDVSAPGEMSACPLYFVHLSVFPLCNEGKKWSGEAISAWNLKQSMHGCHGSCD